jgi:hypothetical protein
VRALGLALMLVFCSLAWAAPDVNQASQAERE